MNAKYIFKITSALLLGAAILCACEKQEPASLPDYSGTPSGPSAPAYSASIYKWGLRELAKANGLMIGAEYTYSEYAMDDSLRVVLKRDFETVTFGNEMKQDQIMGPGGELTFYRADEMAGWADDCGLKLFGHTLAWHNQQQSDYMNSLVASAPNADSAAALVQRAHKAWVDAMVKHFDVYGWDVVNEMLADSGGWRSSSNTDLNGYHKFMWGDYYKGGTKEFVDSAFRNARQALKRYGKTADLYINDYSLEWLGSKLETICQYAESNPDVDGIGTQMHISADMNRDNIKAMLERMVKTGKKVRISELDVAIGKADQAETIVYIFDQYLKIVPEAQRGGITFWGVSDKNSWLGRSKEPLLYSYNYRRKDAYLKLHAYLLERSGLDKKSE